MEKNRVVPLRLCFLVLYVCSVAIGLVQYSAATKTYHQRRARRQFRSPNTKTPRKIHALRKLIDMNTELDSSNTDPYVGSPFSLPPYESLPPFPLPENAPPYCVYPPSTPLGGYNPSPTLPGPNPPLPPSPPESTPRPSPPTILPSPPSVVVPNPPTEPGSGPPYFEPSPPSYGSTPPYSIPSPPSGSVPSPRFLPPIVYPPPTVPPPPRRQPLTAMWCVAKAAVPEPIIQEAMNYACASGADCDQIQPSGSCFQPNTLFAHASYAFNSYWQRTKVTGGTCDFGGTAILVTVDPSYDGCHFIYY